MRPLHLVPLPLRLLQIAEITRTSPLRTPYVIQHHLASPQPNLEHLKTSPERIQPHATNLAISPAHCRLAPQCSPSGKLAKVPSIVTSLYLVPFHLCTLLFSFSAYHCPVPVLYLSLYLLHLVVCSPDSHFSRYPSLSSIVRSYCTWLARLPGCIASHPALHI